MKKHLTVVASILFALCAGAQPLPKIALRPIFPKLECTWPVWMEETPDGSQRFAIVEQDGTVFIAPKGTDGAAARPFLNIEDRKPHASLEQGLLSLAFHPQFKSNG
ncbi:MAG TPA: hypothetical protein VFC44_04085, partial [Candidatus Saccharimonadales bacterium]|nr:hypothetical protein [Candidatus Saccharimonadales bacterium]